MKSTVFKPNNGEGMEETFEQWLESLNQYAKDLGWPPNFDDCEETRECYEDGETKAQAFGDMFRN
jgi:hypothetical protein